MLKDFFKFAKDHKSYDWIHWNMRDINYGFQALEHRYEVLGGRPYIISNHKKFDLAKTLINIYSPNYCAHPRLESITDINHISRKNFLSGKEEAEAFDNKEFVKLHQSTLRKVDVINNIFERQMDGNLKTRATWRDIYGLSGQGVLELIQSNYKAFLAWTALVTIVGALLGAGFGKIIQ